MGPYQAAVGAHALLVSTEWDEYRALDLARVRGLMEVPILVDGRNLYDPSTVRALGFEYYGMGRRNLVPFTIPGTPDREGERRT